LRVYGEEMRDKRMSRAEEKANALPVKLTIPLALFIFPVILIVILVPVVVRVLGSQPQGRVPCVMTRGKIKMRKSFWERS
jgi:hypothetical protein